MPEFAANGTPLSANAFDSAASELNIDKPALWAVISVETSGCGFLPDRRPKILFERHVFSRLTGGKFDADDPDISDPSPGGYGPGGGHQYDRLAAAMQFDRAAALQSASWGLGQILGLNFKAAGFSDADAMAQAMVTSEDEQLRAMVSFMKATGVAQPLAEGHWAGFA